MSVKRGQTSSPDRWQGKSQQSLRNGTLANKNMSALMAVKTETRQAPGKPNAVILSSADKQRKQIIDNKAMFT